MRVSEYYKLDRTQATLDFVDVDVQNDLKVFVDPHAIGLVRSEWANECAALLRDYFSAVLESVKNNDRKRGMRLLSGLREPNETHLGLSAGISKGSGVGDHLAQEIWDSLTTSEAVKENMIDSLEETALLIDGIAEDRVSDITINVLRKSLIFYTQHVCHVYGIPLVSDVDSGPLWNPDTEDWNSDFVQLPAPYGKKLLLVPKYLVRRRMNYDVNEYYTYYLLEELRQEELANPVSNLVTLVKSTKARKVLKKDLIEKYGTGKQVIFTQTRRHPDALSKYRDDKQKPLPPLSHFELGQQEGDLPDLPKLLADVLAISTGRPDAGNYEKAVEKLFSAMFYPSLVWPELQVSLHEGRKRVDIVYDNAAQFGFFYWLLVHYPCPKMLIECKNYGGEVENPELDQLIGRFSPNRGRVGLLVCRAIDDKARFLRRCRDTANDNNGFIITLDDSDLEMLVSQAQVPKQEHEFPLLRQRFNELIL